MTALQLSDSTRLAAAIVEASARRDLRRLRQALQEARNFSPPASQSASEAERRELLEAIAGQMIQDSSPVSDRWMVYLNLLRHLSAGFLGGCQAR